MRHDESLDRVIPVALRDPYDMLKSILTHTRDAIESQRHHSIFDTYLPVLAIAFVWLFLEVAIWFSRK